MPLEELAPDAFTVAEYAIDDVKNAQTFFEAIISIADFENRAERHIVVGKLMLIGDLAKIGKYLADDAMNIRDTMLNDCRLDSEDPEIRKAARP